MTTEERSADVPFGAMPAEEMEQRDRRARRERWSFVEPTVWTDRMLEALEKGVKGGKWFSLIDKVVRPTTLEKAWELVKANRGASGVDRMSIEDFDKKRDKRLRELQEQLEKGMYVPLPVKRVYIPKGDGKMRPLGIPAVRDHSVQAAVRMVIEPIIEVSFSDQSFGFRPEYGCKDALREVDGHLRAGFRYVVDADFKSYFDTIPQDRLLGLVAEKVVDGRVLQLIEAFLRQGVVEELREWTPTSGTPQGGVISPLLANVYLDPLDKLMEKSGRTMIRYADDFVVMCKTREEADAAPAAVQAWTTEAGLTLHPEKTRIVDARAPGGFDSLGYHFERGKKRPRKKSLQKMRDAIRTKTPRNSGDSLDDIVKSLNPTLRGWYAYFKHGVLAVFDDMDQFVRRRLRAILITRSGSKGISIGLCNYRWSNASFAARGLISLSETYRAELRSLRAH